MTEHDAGLLNLKSLRERIRSVDLSPNDDDDTALRALGRGVASRFDSYTGRTLTRGVDIEEKHRGGQEEYFVKAYPIEAVTSVVSQAAYGGTTSTLTIDYVDEASGLIAMTSVERFSIGVTITYTGGFWHDDTETGDGTMPAAATALPEDIADAFATQVQHEAIHRGVFSGGVDGQVARIEGGEGEEMRPASAELLDEVKRTLAPYRKIV